MPSDDAVYNIYYLRIYPFGQILHVNGGTQDEILGVHEGEKRAGRSVVVVE